ncbi:MAG: zinc ribbon domain-containing protein [Clostridiales bacterium]|jgi:RsiW-degrading membrane proteinase PrsW (M82 family)|nr:zinc ribbon domain-containing protein [Clostridiales bacterium]
MLCESCGHKLAKGAIYCGSCGAKIAGRLCPACGGPLGEDTNICLVCGQDATAIAPAKPKAVRRWASNRNDAFELASAEEKAAEVAESEVPKLELGPEVEIKEPDPPKAIPVGHAKEIKSAAPSRAASASSGEIRSASPREIRSASPREIKSATPREIRSASHREIRSASPREIKSASPRIETPSLRETRSKESASVREGRIKAVPARASLRSRRRRKGFSPLGTISSLLDVAALNTKEHDIRFGRLFSEVFKDHGVDSAKALLFGSAKEDSGKPWLFFPVFVALLMAFSAMQGMESVVVMLRGFSSHNAMMLLPGIVFLGSIAAPVSYCILFFETNRRRDIKASSIALCIAAGWVLAFAASFLYSLCWSSLWPAQLGVAIAVAYAALKEALKLFALYFALKTFSGNKILNGLAVGCAIGAGFTIFDTSGAATSAYLIKYGFSSLALREFLFSFGGHVLWTSALGAAVSVSARSGFKISNLFLPDSLRIIAMASIAGIAWEMSDRYVQSVTATALVFIALSVLALAFLLKLVNAGFKEYEKEAAPLSKLA